MNIYQSHCRVLILGLCISGLLPVVGEARNDNNNEFKKTHKSQKSNRLEESYKERFDKNNVKRKQSNTQTIEKKRLDIKQQKEINNRTDRRLNTEHTKSIDTSNEKRNEKRIDRRNTDRARPRLANSSHDIHYRTTLSKQKIINNKSKYVFRHHETYRYHTHYLAPIRFHYYPVNYRLAVLPHFHTRLFVLGVPFFYFDGIFYQSHLSGYIVVRAPTGARVRVLPGSFIAFNIGVFTYYYVNDVYYRWDDDDVRYVVVAKPEGADVAMDEATQGRLFSYPNKGQSEEQQTKDRYECHSWAVSESQVDPTLDEDAELSEQDKANYKRALGACLQGRDYTVK